MVPVGMVAEGVAIPSRLAEIVQTFEILRCVLVVSELVVSPLVMAKLISVCVTEISVCVTEISVCVTEIMGSVVMTVAARPAVSAQCMATPGSWRSSRGECSGNWSA